MWIITIMCDTNTINDQCDILSIKTYKYYTHKKKCGYCKSIKKLRVDTL
jgi:hypothetical protein